MATTDNPLKRLIYTFINDFAPWFLGTDIQSVHPLNVELPAQADLRVDQAFRVTMPTGTESILHVEFQGDGSHRPMKWRMLEYMCRFAETYKIDVCSVVMYLGQGVGERDKGDHQVLCPEGRLSLHWRYRVIRLWQIKAKDLLNLNSPALTTLIGQTQIEQPEESLPLAVQQIQSVEDEIDRGNLLSLLQSLIQTEELSQMVQKLIEEEAFLMDTPFLRRIRDEGRKEGLKAVEISRKEGLNEGRKEGQLITQRNNIFQALVLRFDPLTSVSLHIQKQLLLVTELDNLEALFELAIQGDTLEPFQTKLNEILAAQSSQKVAQK